VLDTCLPLPTNYEWTHVTQGDEAVEPYPFELPDYIVFLWIPDASFGELWVEWLAQVAQAVGTSGGQGQ
jgi:hypothetical protein